MSVIQINNTVYALQSFGIDLSIVHLYTKAAKRVSKDSTTFCKWILTKNKTEY